MLAAFRCGQEARAPREPPLHKTTLYDEIVIKYDYVINGELWTPRGFTPSKSRYPLLRITMYNIHHATDATLFGR